MNKKGIGVGSAFLTLIFVTLCLAVFAMISHTTAKNEITMAKAEAEMVKGYYEADAHAAIIAQELISAETIPQSVFGVDITITWEEDEKARKVEYSLPVSQTRELYVAIELESDTYNILSWRIRDINEWQPDTSLPIRRP